MLGVPEGEDAMATTKDELRRILDALSDEDAAELLEYAHWLRQTGETLSDEEVARVTEGEEQLRRGERVPWDTLRRELNV
jgi:cytochrome c553